MCELNFPISDGGEEEGFNDAGIETFGGNIGSYIARECGQNTADAAKEDSVELHFDLLHIPVEKLPCLDKLSDVFKSCMKYWCSDKKAVKFFDNALSLLSQKTLPILKISDYGTTGLTGDDFDRSSDWYGLVRSKGACNKGEGAGGSFGIGKYAPFAASALRTVYYFTKTESNIAFQGVTRLVTHMNSDNIPTQATGYIGNHNPNEPLHKYTACRSESDIPELFLRSDIGTFNGSA